MEPRATDKNSAGKLPAGKLPAGKLPAGKLPAGKPIGRTAIGIIFYSIVIIIALWLAVEALVVQERESKINDVARTNANLARAFEADTIRTLGYIDENLQVLKSRFEAEGERFDLRGFYKTARVNSAVLRNAVITDETGMIILGSEPSPRISLADRQHVNVHFKQDSGQAFIGQPVEARVNRRLSIIISRRANKPDGTLLGVVAIAVDPSYFSNFYRELDLGRDGIVMLVGLDGIVRARIGDSGDGLGVDVSGGELFRRIGSEPSGSFIAASAIDGVSRINAYRQVRGFPLVVAVGSATEEALAGVTGRARLYRASAALASIAIGMFAGGLIIFGARERRAIARDMAARERAEEKIRISEERLRNAFDAAVHGMTWTALDGRFVKVNAAFCRITGYREHELLARTALDVTHPDDRTAMLAQRLRIEPGKTAHYEMDKRYVRKDGETIWVRINVTLVSKRAGVHDQAGAPLHYITHVEDITERRKTERRLQQAQKMQAVGNLTAGIAHDFNNILGAVIANLDMVAEQAATDPVATERYAREALGAALSGAELVRNLLAFSRQQPLRSRPVAVEASIASVVALLRPILGERMEIKTKVAAELWPAVVDAVQVESAVINLALNARDAMPEGGVLNIGATNVTIDAEPLPASDDLKPGDYVVISVTDPGNGMSPAVLVRAFEPFFTTKGVGAGSGLGLSMVLGTMQQMGGGAKIYSELGHGTTVQLFLPRAGSVAGKDGEQAAAPQQKTGTERILVVDDNALIGDAVAVMLKNLGYAVEVAESADAALALWDGGARFDLVLTDVIMPGRCDGVGLVRALRARDPGIKALLSSGFAYAATAGQEIEEPGLELLQKPYRKAELAARLRAVLDGGAQ